jgi:hypothetical protein
MKRALAIAVVVLFESGACKEETIVLANVKGVDGGGGGPGVRCTISDDCPNGSFCEKPDCNAAAGTCEPFPAVCSDDLSPVCGCDGITYFNDCFRRGGGAASARNDECGHDAISCDDQRGCPEGAYCARLLGFDHGPGCGPDSHGTCWVLPTTCPPPSNSDRWTPCGGSDCVDTCNAIRSGKPHARASSCP